MKKLELADIKAIELNLLIKIDSICRQQHFRYSLCGGTLLGAVRHKGFIPWDDDIDIFMPREDYDSFVVYCLTHEVGFGLLSKESDSNYLDLAAKVFDFDTTIVEKNTNKNNSKIGVFVDVFPIDYLGDSLKEATKNLNKTRLLREILVACNWKRFFRSKTKSIVLEPIRFLLFLLSRISNGKKIIKKIERINKGFANREKKYSGCICGVYRNKEIMPTGVFENFAPLEFEGHFFNATTEYDYYLHNFYGDYMKLPPLDKQTTHHEFDAFLISK